MLIAEVEKIKALDINSILPLLYAQSSSLMIFSSKHSKAVLYRLIKKKEVKSVNNTMQDENKIKSVFIKYLILKTMKT